MSVRWDERRLDTYAEYGRSVKNYVTLLRRVAANMGLDSVAHPLPRSVGLPRIEEAEDERASRFEGVLLLGTPSTVAVARKWHRAA